MTLFHLLRAIAIEDAHAILLMLAFPTAAALIAHKQNRKLQNKSTVL